MPLNWRPGSSTRPGRSWAARWTGRGRWKATVNGCGATSAAARPGKRPGTGRRYTENEVTCRLTASAVTDAGCEECRCERALPECRSIGEALPERVIPYGRCASLAARVSDKDRGGVRRRAADRIAIQRDKTNTSTSIARLSDPGLRPTAAGHDLPSECSTSEGTKAPGR